MVNFRDDSRFLDIYVEHNRELLGEVKVFSDLLLGDRGCDCFCRCAYGRRGKPNYRKVHNTNRYAVIWWESLFSSFSVSGLGNDGYRELVRLLGIRDGYDGGYSFELPWFVRRLDELNDYATSCSEFMRSPVNVFGRFMSVGYYRLHNAFLCDPNGMIRITRDSFREMFELWRSQVER